MDQSEGSTGESTSFIRRENNAPAGKVISAEELGAIVEGLVSGSPRLPKPTVFETQSDLFAAMPDIEKAAKEEGEDGEYIPGVVHNGKVYLVRENFSSRKNAMPIAPAFT